MTPDQAAAKLQIEERGLKLLKLCEAEPAIFKALQAVQSGFSAADVAEMYELEWSAEEDDAPDETEGAINVWECKTTRCRQKGRVSTATDPPQCPSCHQEMEFLMSVNDQEDIGHMRRTYVPNPGLNDPLARTDRTNAPMTRGEMMGDD